MSQLDQAKFIAERLKELQTCRKNIRANLAAARMLYHRRKGPDTRFLVVAAMSNLETVNAMIEALESSSVEAETTKSHAWFNPINLRVRWQDWRPDGPKISA